MTDFNVDKTLILKGSSGAGGGGENGPRAPFHEAHFRLLSELRSVIKKSRNKRGKFKTSPEMVRFYNSARTYFTTYGK